MREELTIDEARPLLHTAEHVAVFTGAGISAESGIPTFRDGGFWDEFPPSQFATWSGLTKLAATNPARLAEFVHCVVGPIAAAEPNAAHQAIATFSNKQRRVEVLTQNVDGLHQSAGSVIVHEVHGSLLRRIDGNGRNVDPLSRKDLRDVAERLAAKPRTILGFWRAIRPLMERRGLGVVRPDIVLFNDEMAEPDWTKSQAAAKTCDAMLTVGTSAQVYPAAFLPLTVQRRGRPVITVDPSPPEDGYWVPGKASEIVPALLS